MILLSLSFFVACCFVASTNQVAQAATVYYSLDVMPMLQNSLSPDCANNVFLNRPVLTVNGKSPGPVITAMEGDTIVVNVTNHQQSESFSMHWHGLHQHGTPYMDGASGITQCALGPLQSQVYRFEANPSGTFFYHAHKSMLDSDGASGMLVVTPKQSNSKTPAYDEERHVFLKDWWHATSDQQVVGLMASPFVFVGSPDAILVNGKAIWFQCAQGGQYFNNSNYCLSTCTNMSSSLETINVSAGKTYRLRIVNAASLVIMNVAFKDHNLTIIEQDGTMIDPVEVTSLDLSPGQRFSVLLEANQDPATYWMKVSVRFRNYPNITGLAILQYEEANTTIPSLTTESPLNVMWNDTMFGMAQEGTLKTQDPSSFSESSALRADSSTIRRLILVSTQAKDPSTGGLVWAINNVSSNGMTTSPEPLLMRAYEAASIEYPGSVEGTVDLLENPPVVFNYSNPLVEGPGPMVGSKATQILRLLKGDVVEIIFQNTRALNNVSELHSWHVHGHSAWVVGMGSGTFDATKDVANYNLVNPVLQDTFDMYPLGWTAIRLVADNPGAWLFHCHLSSHIIMGMEFTIITSPNEIDSPPEGATSCTQTSLDESPSSSQIMASEGFYRTSNMLLVFVTLSFATFVTF